MIALLAVFQIYRVQTDLSRPAEFYLNPGEISHGVRLRQWGGQFVLVDTENRQLQRRGEKLINPLVLSPTELLKYADHANSSNPWVIFANLYLNYYEEFYWEQFDRKLNRFDREVSVAYEYWKAHPP